MKIKTKSYYSPLAIQNNDIYLRKSKNYDAQSMCLELKVLKHFDIWYFI
jgi:hypothetical protein